MMKYIIFWSLSKIVFDPCPDIVKPDKFGRVSMVQISCAAIHCHSEFLGIKHKIFFNRDSAIYFYREAFEQSRSSFNSGIESVMIDSLLIKKQR